MGNRSTATIYGLKEYQAKQGIFKHIVHLTIREFIQQMVIYRQLHIKKNTTSVKKKNNVLFSLFVLFIFLT